MDLKSQSKVNDNGLINDNEIVRLTCYATETHHYHDLVITKNKDDHGIFRTYSLIREIGDIFERGTPDSDYDILVESDNLEDIISNFQNEFVNEQGCMIGALGL